MIDTNIDVIHIHRQENLAIDVSIVSRSVVHVVRFVFPRHPVTHQWRSTHLVRSSTQYHRVTYRGISLVPVLKGGTDDKRPFRTKKRHMLLTLYSMFIHFHCSSELAL